MVMPTSRAVLAGLAGLLTCSCGLVQPEAAVARDPGGRLTANEVRACLDRHPREEGRLLFRTTTKSSDNFVGVLMMDLDRPRSLPATVGIAVYDDADLLDAYEERARQDPHDTVIRFRNAVVSYHGPFTGKLAEGRRWVRLCLAQE